MANEEHLAQLRQGVKAWNEWRAANRAVQPDLTEADLINADLSRADFRDTDFTRADLSGADLTRADLTGAHLLHANLGYADLTGALLRDARLGAAHLSMALLSNADLSKADLMWAELIKADLTGAHLSGVDLRDADLSEADLTRADLHEANLQGARLVETKFEDANLTGCRIYGISAWDLKLTGARQAGLVITPGGGWVITVDNLEVAQFIYLLLHNEKLREVIDTITSKAVLILGRFTPERKVVLNAIREELRRRNYLPIVFDFEKPASRDLTETISTLAHMARFIIADLTEAKSIPQELQRIVPDLPSVPVQPVLQASAEEYSMFEHFTRYPWVLETYRYQNLDEVIAALPEKVIVPAELKAKELVGPMRR